MFRNLLPAAALLVGLVGTLASTDAFADDDDETRRDKVVERFDYDHNTRLDGKEMKDFRKQKPKMFDNLMEFCDEATEHPKRNGVELPADPTKEQLQCKKKHVSRLFLNAWTAKGQPIDDGGGDKPPSIDHSDDHSGDPR